MAPPAPGQETSCGLDGSLCLVLLPFWRALLSSETAMPALVRQATCENVRAAGGIADRHVVGLRGADLADDAGIVAARRAGIAHEADGAGEVRLGWSQSFSWCQGMLRLTIARTRFALSRVKRVVPWYQSGTSVLAC
jgi:hypothetical protein